MPFGIFVGMNSHGKTILFGCAFLHNETMSAFHWLMKVTIALFLCLFDGKEYMIYVRTRLGYTFIPLNFDDNNVVVM